MIQLRMNVFEAGANGVRPFDLGCVDIARVLVIAKLERAAGIGVSNIRNTRDLKAGNALVIRSGAVGSRDVQHVRSVIAVLRIAIGPDILARVANIAIEKQSGRGGIGESSRGHLDASAGMARIAAVERIAARRAEDERINDVHGRDAVAAPDHRFVDGIIVDLPIVAIHGVGR